MAAPLIVTANQDKISGNATTIIATGAPPPSISITDLLPEKLAGAKATSEVKQYTPETLAEFAADKTAIYQEYKVTLAASRLYGTTRVEVLKTANSHAAFGLFTYTAKTDPNKALWKEPEAVSTLLSDSLVFWKQSYFVKVSNATPGGKNSPAHTQVAMAVAHLIPTGEAIVGHPILFDSLPKNSLVAYSERYFFGPESLNAYFERARDMFSFDGEAHAVVAEYRKTQEAKPLKFVIIEYHTPQFCTDAMNRLSGFMATLSEDERNRFLIKRTGNFIVAATNFTDREFAESLLNSVEYPYLVQWLQNPAIPTNDPFAIQKAGQILVSTFNLIGLSGGIMLLSGGILGTTLFLRRRKQQRETFSDAGGMIGLHLDPIEEAMLSLPAARDEVKR